VTAVLFNPVIPIMCLPFALLNLPVPGWPYRFFQFPPNSELSAGSAVKQLAILHPRAVEADITKDYANTAAEGPCRVGRRVPHHKIRTIDFVLARRKSSSRQRSTAKQRWPLRMRSAGFALLQNPVCTSSSMESFSSFASILVRRQLLDRWRRVGALDLKVGRDITAQPCRGHCSDRRRIL
jgi:hypothetical protein